MIAIFACASSAMAEELVPPGNSAVNQYTETFPTSGGDKEAKHGSGKGRSPAKVLGERNAQKLEEHGPDGREAAQVAAATAPSPVAATPEPEPGDEETSDERGGAAGNGGGNGGGDATVAPARPVVGATNGGATPPVDEAAESSGSSGFGEVLAQATGTSSSGGLGLLLPLAILATAVWALASLRRRSRRTAH